MCQFCYAENHYTIYVDAVIVQLYCIDESRIFNIILDVSKLSVDMLSVVASPKNSRSFLALVFLHNFIVDMLPVSEGRNNLSLSLSLSTF